MNITPLKDVFTITPTVLDLFRVIEDEPLEDFVIQKDHNQWDSLIQEFRDTQIFGLDIETYGRESWHGLYPWKGRIRIITIALPSGKSLVLNFGGWKEQSQWEEIKQSYSEVLDLLKQKCEDWRVITLGQNLKFDAVWLRVHHGIRCRQIRDMMIISQVLYAGLGVEKAKKGEDRSERCNLSHSLGGICERLGIDINKDSQKSDWGRKLTNRQLNYAAFDSLVLFQVYEKLRKLVKEAGCEFSARTESNCVAVFAEMEFNGFPVNLEKLEVILAFYKQKQEEVLTPFRTRWPTVNWQSVPEVLACLQKDLGLKIESCGKEVLSPFSNHPEIEGLLNARTLNNAINYLESTRENYFDGATRTHFTQIAPSGSGRSSCSKSLSKKAPDTGIQLQNPIGKIYQFPELPPVREVFEAPEGYCLGIYDASASHARIATELSKSKLLVEIYQNDFDGHSVLAANIINLARKARVSDVCTLIPRDIDADEAKQLRKGKLLDFIKAPIKEVSSFVSNVRDLAKTALYSSLNGSGVGKLTTAAMSQFAWFTRDLGQSTSNLFKGQYPELVVFIRKTHQKVSSFKIDFSHFNDRFGTPLQGRWGLNTTLTGRRIYFRHYPSSFKEGETQVSYTDCTSSNWLLPESDIMKSWGNSVLQESDKFPEWDFRIVNFAHDEWNFIWKEEYTDAVTQMIWATMQEAFTRWIKIIPFVEASYDPKSGVCKNWSEK